MSILIPGKMPTECWDCPCAYETEGAHHNYCQAAGYDTKLPDEGRPDWCPLIELPPHGRLIDADALRRAMYHEAFETDSPMQKWDSGCWIRYKMFERMEEAAPTIIPAEGGDAE